MPQKNNRQNRRRRWRWGFADAPRALDHERGALLGYVADINTEGMRLVTPQPITAGREYRLILEMPQEDNEIEQVTLTATSVWTKQRTDQHLPYEAGFRFSQAVEVIMI